MKSTIHRLCDLQYVPKAMIGRKMHHELELRYRYSLATHRGVAKGSHRFMRVMPHEYDPGKSHPPGSGLVRGRHDTVAGMHTALPAIGSEGPQYERSLRPPADHECTQHSDHSPWRPSAQEETQQRSGCGDTSNGAHSKQDSTVNTPITHRPWEEPHACPTMDDAAAFLRGFPIRRQQQHNQYGHRKIRALMRNHLNRGAESEQPALDIQQRTRHGLCAQTSQVELMVDDDFQHRQHPFNVWTNA